MDILTHTIAGLAVGSTVAGFSKGSTAKKVAIIAAGGSGGFLPDVDVVSLWSGFDGTFGKLFGLQHTGKAIYFGKFWYSHHGFMHSLLAGILIGALFLFAVYLVSRKRNTVAQSFRKNSLLFLSFTGGYITHLICDMLTPGSTWGGVNFFFPAKAYTGGWGYVWWWNNYDIFLLFLVLFAFNIIILSISHFRVNFPSIKFCTPALVACVLLIGIQCARRPVNFAYSGHSAKYNEYEKQSKQIQQKILGKKVYRMMERFDNAVPVNF